MNSIYFPKDIDQFRERVNIFFSTNVLPFIDEWEKKRAIPRDIWLKMGEEGFLGLHYPKNLGGQQQDLFYSIAFLEELGRLGYSGFRGAVSVHSYMATEYLLQAGSEQLKQDYLSPAISGKKVAALAITEAQAGSDAANLQCTAIRNNDEYEVSGNKIFVTNGVFGDFYTTAVKISKKEHADADGGLSSNVSLLVIDANSPGVSVKQMEKMGWHCSDTAEITFDRVKVPTSNLIGRENFGFYYLMKGFQLERLAAATVALGELENCLATTVKYIQQRQIFGKNIAQFQCIRHQLAELFSEAEAVKQLIYHAAWLHKEGKLPMRECSMAKLRATELSSKTANTCFQFFGGHGYEVNSDISRIFKDTRLSTIVGGTSEIMREIISEHELGPSQ